MRIGPPLLTLGLGVAVATAAFFGATGVASLVGATLDGALPIPEARASTTSPSIGASDARGSDARPSADAILARNPFESRGPEVPRSSDELCDGVRPVVVVASGDPSFGFAALDVGGRRVLKKRGDDVYGMRLVHIGADRVWLEKGGVVCQASVFAPAARAERAPRSEIVTATPSPRAGAAGPSALETEIARHIVKRGPNDYEIDRATVERILEAQSELMKGRVVPEKQGDRVVGVRLYGVKPGSVLSLIGIENGDRLETVNGFEMGDPSQALEAYARLRGAERLVLRLTRAGKTTEIDYTIR